MWGEESAGRLFYALSSWRGEARASPLGADIKVTLTYYRHFGR
jgi:hypothetical protein